jgi:hypothetical protein
MLFKTFASAAHRKENETDCHGLRFFFLNTSEILSETLLYAPLPPKQTFPPGTVKLMPRRVL